MRSKFYALFLIGLTLMVALARCGGSGGGGGGGGGGTGGTPLVWSGTKQLGASGQFTQSNAVTVDSASNVIECGYTQGGLDGNTLTGTFDGFVRKYNSNGTKAWTRQFGVAADTTQCLRAVADSTGNIFVVGYTNGSLDGTTTVASTWGYLMKINSAGVIQWTKMFGGNSGGTYGYALTLGASSSIFVTGSTSVNLNGQTLTGTYDMALIKFDSTGTAQWTTLFGATSATVGAYGVGVDSGGNVFVAGQTDHGLGGNPMIGTTDAYEAKFDSSGTFQTAHQFGVSGTPTHCADLAVDSGDNVLVTGYAYGSIYGGTYMGAGAADFYVVKYDSTGTFYWEKQLGVSGVDTHSYGVTTDSSNNVIVTGYTDGNLDGIPLTGVEDGFVTQFDNLGTKKWTKLEGVSGKATDAAGKPATDVNGNVFISGTTTGGLDGNTVTGTYDAFITKFSSTGVKQ
jgi:hypothetical protein